MEFRNLPQERRFRSRDILDCLARHRLRQKADKVAGVTRLESDPDFTVRLETAYARTMAGSRIDNDKGPARRIDCNSSRRNNAHQSVIDRAIELTSVDYDFNFVIQHVRCSFGEVFPILIAALSQHVQEQNSPLRGVHGVVKGRPKQAESRERIIIWPMRLVRRHDACSRICLSWRRPRD